MSQLPSQKLDKEHLVKSIRRRRRRSYLCSQKVMSSSSIVAERASGAAGTIYLKIKTEIVLARVFAFLSK